MNYKSGICIKRPAVGILLSGWPIDDCDKFILLRKYLFGQNFFNGEEYYDISTDKDMFDRGYISSMSPEEIEEHFLILE
jgi:hypothetical protein